MKILWKTWLFGSGLLCLSVAQAEPVRVMRWDQKPAQWRVASDGKGGAVTAWIEQNTSTRRISAQRIAFNRRLPWGPKGIPVGSSAVGIADLQIVSNGRGGAVLGWREEDNGQTRFWIQEISAEGRPRWAPSGRQVSAHSGSGSAMALAARGGMIFVAWEESEDASPLVRSQRYDRKGQALWPDGWTVAAASGTFQQPGIVPDRDGGFFVLWTSNDDAGIPLLLGQSINSSGHPLWDSRGLVVSTHRNKPRIEAGAVARNHDLVVVWSDPTLTGESWGGQLLDSSGQRRWGADGIVLLSQDNNQENTCVAMDETGRFAMAWEERHGGKQTVLAQQWDSTGVSAWGSSVAMSQIQGEKTPEKWQAAPALAVDLHDVIVLWLSGVDTSDLLAQRFNKEGKRSWESGIRMSSVAPGASQPLAVSDEAGGALVLWIEPGAGQAWQLNALRVGHAEFTE